MLAATPDRNSSLGLFEVVLRSVELKPAVQVSDSLKGHVVEILKAALSVAANPAAIKSDTPSEAIELALLLRKNQELQHRLSTVGAFENIQSDMAKDLLASIHSVAT